MALFLCNAWSTDSQFQVTHCTIVPITTHYNSDGMGQIVVPQGSEFHELFIKELYVATLASHLGVKKLTHALFQRVW